MSLAARDFKEFIVKFSKDPNIKNTYLFVIQNMLQNEVFTKRQAGQVSRHLHFLQIFPWASSRPKTCNFGPT